MMKMYEVLSSDSGSRKGLNEGRQGELWSAKVNFAIGGSTEDPRYHFGEVNDMVLLPNERFIVADGRARRVAMFDADGRHFADIGRMGEGPGEFSWPYAVAVDPYGSIWIHSGRDGYHVFEQEQNGAVYVRSVLIGRAVAPTKPVFAKSGEVGLRVLLDSAASGVHGIRVWLDEKGAVRREERLAALVPIEELGYRNMTWQGEDRRVEQAAMRGPFGPRDILVDGPSGEYARVVTSRYVIELYDSRGIRSGEIRRDEMGAQVSDAEREREQAAQDSIRSYWQGRGADYPAFTVPRRKPPIEGIWYDQGGRIWVETSRAEGVTTAGGHVYDAEGRFVADAEWPMEVRLNGGAIERDVVLGVGTGAFDVPVVVRMTLSREA